MRGSSVFVRIVAHRCAFLMSVQRLHRRIEVERVLLREQGREAVQVLVPHPLERCFGIHAKQTPPHRIAGLRLRHSEKLGGYRVAEKRIEMTEPLRTVENAERGGADYIALFGCVIAGVD